MSQVLCARESFKRETIQKLPLAHNTMHRFQHKPCLTLQIQRQFLKLWNPLINFKHFVQSLHLVFIPLAHAVFVQTPQLFINTAPKLGFLGLIIYFRDLLVDFVGKSNFGDFIPSCSVFGIRELQMIPVDLIFDFEKGFSELINVLLVGGEPGDLNWAG